MAQKERMFNKLVILICSVLIIGCGKNENSTNEIYQAIIENVDVSKVPNHTVYVNDTALKLLNGVYHYNGKPFSGFIKTKYKNDSIKSISSYLDGKQHGIAKSFFHNGVIDTERNFKNGKAYGKHIGYWENGNKKFEFIYANDKREGIQKQWYETGTRYCELNYTNDSEKGMQKAWRENGKLYTNYEVKNGVRYGLQKSGLCYGLKDQEVL
jgi:antitoxin component YwqK of YwqJK toxin-antitoxin module